MFFLETDVCTPNPCKNSGKCLIDAVEDESKELEMNDAYDSKYVCICPAGYTGKLCETSMTFCCNAACLRLYVHTMPLHFEILKTSWRILPKTSINLVYGQKHFAIKLISFCLSVVKTSQNNIS